MRFNKKGVSLVTVLLFMLVATIAGTATYKWLSSEGRTSASRMLMNEARQSALAGLEAARSWIANNANDAGAVVKTFYDNERKPVKMTSLLNSINKSTQDYDVYLVGVEKINQIYRMKLLAEGRSQNGTTYSEISIIKVSGLYQVQLPSKPSSPAFEHAFFGSTSNPHNMNMTSSIVNGDFLLGSATGAHINGDLVVTGNLSILKDSKITGNVVVEGSATGCEGLVVGKNLRIKDKWYPSLKDSVYGHLYTDNGISFEAHSVYDSPTSAGAKCVTYPAKPLYVRGNWSSNGDVKLISREDTIRFIVEGSSVIKGNITVDPRIDPWSGNVLTAETYASMIEMHLDKNVYLDGGFTSGIFPDVSKSSNLSLGTDASNKIYIKTNANRISDGSKNLTPAYSTLWNNAFNRFSYSSGIFYSPNIYNMYNSMGINVPKNTFCHNSQCIPAYDQQAYATHADSKKDVYYQVNGTIESSPDTTGWGASFYEVVLEEDKNGNCEGKHIKDPIQFNKEILKDKKVVHSVENGNACPGVEQSTNFAWESLNKCHEDVPEDELYQGKWLVVRVKDPNWWYQGTPKLKYNMIIVVDGSPSSGQLNVPPTGDDNNVLWYFPGGFSTFQLEGANSADKYNYFIYSEGDIATIRLRPNGSNAKMTGSLFMSKCAVAGGTEDWNIEFNKSMLDGMSTDNIFCEYDDTYNCNTSSGTTAGSGSTSESESVDPYHVATSPQLSVVLESQYRNTELSIKKRGFVEPEPSVIVLPRFVYLAENPYGKLSDYYTVIGVNGAEKNVDQNRMSCPSDIPTGSAPLYDGSTLLTKGRYTCVYEYNNGGKKIEVPLYVIVNGTLGESPEVTFDNPNKEISAGGSVMVKLDEITADHAITVTVTGPSASNLASGWSYVVQDGVTMVRDDGYNAVYKVTFVPSGNKKNLFEVKTEDHAAQGNAIFYLTDPCEDCIIGDPISERVYMSGFVRVKRDSSLTTYCSNENNAAKFKEQYGEDCDDVAHRPTCEGISDWTKNWSNWVTAVSGCAYEVKNNQWMCNASDPIHLQSLMLSHDVCQVYTPDSTLTELDLGSQYVLPGALKRKPSNLTIKVMGKKSGGKVIVNYSRPGVHASGEFEKLTECSSDSDCNPTTNVYAGDIIKLTVEKGGDKFSYWICNGSNCRDNKQGVTDNSSEYQMAVTGSNTIEAHFNEKDSHCIYNDFSQTVAYCDRNSNDDCIDKCADGTYNCSVKDGAYPDANWIQVYANNRYLGGQMSHYTKPKISSGKIFADGVGIDGPTLILGRIESGYNGTMTALFEVPTVISTSWNSFIGKANNDGFIIRSDANANNYLQLSVTSKIDHGFRTFARLCYVGGVETKLKDGAGNNNCVDAPFAGTLTGKEPVLVTKLTNASITITANDNIITANLSYNFGGSEFGSSYASIDLDTTTLKNKIPDNGLHNYVGFKLAEPTGLQSLVNTQFKVYDIAWRTADIEYEKSCWDTPTVYCSFDANFVGGMVPDSVDVSPWVSTSSWFADKAGSCTFSYYYNGCDVPSEYFNSSVSILSLFADRNACKTGHGYYDKSAKELDLIKKGVLKSGVYNFTEEGDHGVPYEGGYENDASVMVTCVGNDGDGHRYDTRCGRFYVGEIVRCSESYPELLERAYTGSTSDAYTIPIKGGPVNVRESDFKFTIAGLVEGASISVKLLDEDGDSSNVAAIITGDGVVSFNVGEDVSKMAGFNPQKVTALKFSKSDIISSYTVSNAQSVCPYALTMSCNAPQYDPTTEKWLVSANVTQAGQAYGCKVTALGDAFALGGINIPEDPISCAYFKTYLAQKGVYGYEGSEGFYFRVEAVKQNGEVLESCETEKVTMPKVSISCSVSSTEVERGAYVPSLSFNIDGCTEDGCVYVITEPDGKKTKATGKTASGHCPNGNCKSMNTVVDPLALGEYSYQVSAYGKTCEIEPKFEVTQPASIANCSSASIEDGVFKASVDNDDWTGSLVFTDHNGGASREISVNGGMSFTYDVSAETKGSIVTLYLSGKQCAARVGGTLSLSCPSSVTVSNGEASFTPTISGCGDGCSWTSTKGSVSYSAGTLTLSGITESGEATITAKSEYKETKSCKVELSVSQGSQEGCNCTCDPEACKNVVTAGWNSSNPYACYFTDAISTNQYDNTDVSVHLPSPGDKVNINGVDYIHDEQHKNMFDNMNTWSVRIYQWGDSKKIDGGVYFQIKKMANNGWVGAMAFHGGTPNCSGGSSTPSTPSLPAMSLTCPTFDTNQEQESLLQFTPTVVGCDGGCQYTLNVGDSYVNNGAFYTDNQISFKGAKEAGEKTYTLSMTRDSDNKTESCNFTVTYNALEEEPPVTTGVVKVTMQFEKKDPTKFEVGKEYEIKCEGNIWCHRLICAADGGGKELWLNDEKAWTSFDWQTKNNFQSVGDGACHNGNKIKVKNGTLYCKYSW